MKITEEQKQKLIDLNDSRVNEILDLGLKIGEWYKKKSYGDLMFYFKGGYTGLNLYKNYGFDYDGIFQKEIGVHKHQVDKYYEATYQEVAQALIKEAKKRGFKKGVKFKCLIKLKVGVLTEDFFLYNGSFGGCNSLESEFKNDVINGVLFKDGVWAEIIDGNPEQNKVTIDIRFPYTRDKQKHEVLIIEELEDNQILVEFKDKERLILSKDCIVIE